jgi:protein gp37
MADTKIDWADKVWNPVTGCTKVSAGCKNCYAERIAKRLWASQYEPMADGRPRKFTDVVCHKDRLSIPLHWKKPAKIFVNSMSDLFHEDVPLEFVLRMWLMMAQTSNHTYMILTKRPARMSLFVNEWLPGAWGLATMSLKLLDKPLPNVWLGVSVENQKAADERISLLLQTPAAVRFVSVEPMLEQIYLRNYLPRTIPLPRYKQDGKLIVSDLDWVICGSESGQGARPFDIEWARNLKNQCVDAGVPFFLKQMTIDGKLVKMPELDGKVWDQYPEKKG